MGSVSTTAVHATCTRLTKGLMGILFSQLSLFGSLGRFLFFFPSFSFSFFFLFKDDSVHVTIFLFEIQCVFWIRLFKTRP